MNWRLGILVSHPVQYYAPWFRHLSGRLDIEVFYAHRQDARGQAAAGFGVEFDWDVPLLEGYRYQWLHNVSRRPNLRSFHGCDTPEIFTIIRANRFDAFLVFGWNRKSALQAILACRRNHVPVLMRGDSHLMTPRSWVKVVVKYFPYRWLLPRLDAHLYVGKRNREYLEYYGVPADRLFFVPHCVDNAFFAQHAREAIVTGKTAKIRHDFGIPAGAFVFVFVGKMTPKKRPHEFIDACLRIFGRRTGAGIHALLVGDGPLRADLERLAGRGSGRIHFAGFRNQSEIPAFIRASDALVLPSDSGETWGLVVNEAAACGVPAVVSDAVGCAPDLIDDGRTGYTYRLGDVDALAERMLALKAELDRDLGGIQEALARKMAYYSIEHATERLTAVLERLAGRASVRTFLHAEPGPAGEVSPVDRGLGAGA